jgi:beta-aspartyl-peptidase (threonine type)
MIRKTFAVAVHGGAGAITRSARTGELEAEFNAGLLVAVESGYSVLSAGGSSLDAVEAAVSRLEDNVLFNAGKGSVFNHTGTHEMDASIMRGDTLKAGAVAGIRGVQNPISLARAVMERTSHVMLCGSGAEEFARQVNLPLMPDSYFYSDFRHQQWRDAVARNVTRLDHSKPETGTVGAVAIDENGNLAAATSTGGLTNKHWSRIGDSAIIGAGTYANDRTCAVSCTGYGEFFIRTVAAHQISCLMEYSGQTLQAACDSVLHQVAEIGGSGGVIAIDRGGNICTPFNTEGMYRAWLREGEAAQVRIYA